MTILARNALVGVVYLTPKGRALERIERAADADPEDDTVPFRRLDDGSTFPLAPDYVLTPKPVEAAPSRVDALKGQRIDDVIAAVVGSVEPYVSAPLTDDELEELLASDTRGRVQRAIEEEGAKRAAGGRPVPAAVEAIMPAQPFDSAAFGGPVEVKPVGAEVEAERADPLTAEVEEFGAPLVSRPAPLKEVPADPPVGAGATIYEMSATVGGMAVDRLREEANEVADGESAEIGTASASGLLPSGGGGSVATAVDDIPWPASTPPEAEPVAVQVDGATTATTGDGESVAPAEVAPTTESTTTATKPEKTRPRGYCPACRQHLTVRADGTMMQHYTPDGAKGPDGKRLDCQGVGLAPRSERPDEPRLPLPVAMGAEPAVATIDRPMPGTDGDRLARALDAIREHDADTPSVAVRVDPTPAPAPVSRYTLGGATPYGFAIIDYTTNEAMRREDGAPALWEHEDDAQAALVYVREHGELPDGTQPEDPAPVPLDSEPVDTTDLDLQAFTPEGIDEVAARAKLRGDFPNLRPDAPSRMSVSIDKPPTTAQACDAIDTLTRHVADAKARGVYVEITIKPLP